LSHSAPDVSIIDDTVDLRFKPRVDDELEAAKQEVTLPGGFGYAEYGVDDQGMAFVKLSFGNKLPSQWDIREPGQSQLVYSEEQWTDKRKPKTVTLSWEKDLPPSGFEVRWPGSEGVAWWPVNIVATNALPPPKELSALPLEVLINILTSARPLHEVLRGYLMRKLKHEEEGNEALIDPHKRVDTSAFLLQRTRRLSFALSALRNRLEAPMATREILHWRLHGPVGVRALKDAILAEAHSETEKQFLVAELALELSRIEPRPMVGCLAPETVKAELKALIEAMQDDVRETGLCAADNLHQYITTAFEKALA
jgi:hypothetical protein